MSVWKKLFTAIKGNVNEAAEAVVDSQALTILDQEMRETREEIRRSEQSLTSIVAKEKLSGKKVADIKKAIEEHEGYAVQALEKDDQELALAVAEKISALESELTTQQQALDSFEGNANRLKELVKKSERQVAEYKRQLSMVKTTESVQKATSAITDNFSSSNSKLLNAKDSLERIKAKQQKFDDQMKAAEVLESENSDASLEAKLKAAGIGGTENSANSVLERLKAKQQK